MSDAWRYAIGQQDFKVLREGNAVYILLTLIGTETDTEAHTSDGRIDLVVKTDDYIYVIELKFDRSA